MLVNGDFSIGPIDAPGNARAAVAHLPANPLRIRGMRERLHQLHGELKIESSDRGTCVFATIPILQAAGEESGIEPVRALM